MIIVALLLASGCFGQDTDRYYIRHFDTDNGLPQNTIKGMKMDSHGFLWVLTEAGLVRFDGEQFRVYDRLPDGRQLTSRMSALEMTAGDDIIVLDTAQNAYQPVTLGVISPCPVPEAVRIRLRRDIPAFVNDRCYALVASKKQPAWILPSFKLNDIGSGKGISIQENTYYWFNDRNELICADSGLHRFRRITLKGFPAGRDGSQQVRIVSQREKLVIQWGQYLCIGRPGSDGCLKAERRIFTGQTGPVTQYEEPGGGEFFFAGTLSNGLYQFTRQEFVTKTFKGNVPNVFYAQAPIGEKEVLSNKGIVTGNGGPRLDSFRPFSVLKTRAGGYVLSKWSHRTANGLSFFDSALHLTDFIAVPRPAIGGIFELSDGSLCVSALGNYFGRVTGRRIEWFSETGPLKDFQVSALQEIRPGLLWLAGPNGLGRFDLNSRSWVLVPGLEGLQARTLYLDSLGILWVGTYGNGFFACIDGKLIKMPLDADGYLKHVHAFMVDRRGFCWMSTNRGLFEVHLSAMQSFALGKTVSVYYHYYDRNAGFLSDEFNGGCVPSAVETRSGLFSFPSMNGIVQFDPLRVRPLLSNSDIYIERVTVDAQYFDHPNRRLELSSGAREITVTISSPYWGIPNNHHVEYRLEGMDSVWRPVPVSGVISFERLPGGNYQLDLRKPSGFDGQQVVKSQLFHIPYAFYEKWPYRVSALVAILLLVWLSVRLRFRYLTQAKRRLELEVADRTRELSRNMRLLEMVSMTLSHDLQSPLRFFAEVSANLHAKASGIGQPALEGLSRDLMNASGAIHHFVKDFGCWVKSLEHRFEVNPEPIELDILLREIAAFSKDMLKLRGNVLGIIGKSGCVIESDRQLLQTILRNLLDNANKYTKNGSITLEVRVDGEYASIVVSDNGRGFQGDKLSIVRRILSHAYDGMERFQENSGFGYYFIADFSKLLHIQVTAENPPTGGAAITLGKLKITGSRSPKVEKTIDYDTHTFSG
jgi:hypothetical protein